jgi:hypothetical protein
MTLTLASKELSTKIGWVCAPTETAQNQHKHAKPGRINASILTTQDPTDHLFDSMTQV